MAAQWSLLYRWWICCVLDLSNTCYIELLYEANVLTVTLYAISLQMLLTGSTSWHTIASPPARLNWHTTVTGPPEQGSWSAGKLLGSPVCELHLVLYPTMFFPSAMVTAAVLFILFVWLVVLDCSSDSGPAHLSGAPSSFKHNEKMTLNVKQLPWFSCILLELRGNGVTGLVFVNI